MSAERGEHTDIVTLGVLLESERTLTRLVYYSFAGLLVTVASMGIAYGTMASKVNQLATRIEEIRAEGSVPVQGLSTQLRVMTEQLKQTTDHVADLTTLTMRNEAALIRIETRLRR